MCSQRSSRDRPSRAIAPPDGDEDRRRREDRLKKFMEVEKGRRDIEDRKQRRKELERQTMDYEDRMKRKRDESDEGLMMTL